jgi:hypothetical protein
LNEEGETDMSFRGVHNKAWKERKAGTLFLLADLKKGRGWTDAMVRDLLGEHDAEAPNPNYVSGPPCKFFEAARVLRAEETDAFKLKIVDGATRERRSASAAKAVQTRLNNLLRAAEQVEIVVEKGIPREEIERMRFGQTLGGRDVVSSYLATARHALTNYDALLAALANRGEVIGEPVYELIRERCDDAVLEAYPWIADADEL